MLRYRFSLLAAASMLALGLAAAPALAKGGNGHGGGGGNGHGVGHDVSGSSQDTSTSTDVEASDTEDGLPSKAIDNKTNSGAYHSANAPDPNATESTDGKAPNPNSAV